MNIKKNEKFNFLNLSLPMLVKTIFFQIKNLAFFTFFKLSRFVKISRNALFYFFNFKKTWTFYWKNRRKVIGNLWMKRGSFFHIFHEELTLAKRISLLPPLKGRTFSKPLFQNTYYNRQQWSKQKYYKPFKRGFKHKNPGFYTFPGFKKK